MAQRRRTVAQWRNLSPTTRARYERNGITQGMYMRGDSLSAARGHAKTPERPERAVRNPDRYREYVANPRHRETLTTVTAAREKHVTLVFPWFDALSDTDRRKMAREYNRMMQRGPAVETGSLAAKIKLYDMIADLSVRYADVWDDTDSNAYWARYKEAYRLLP